MATDEITIVRIPAVYETNKDACNGCIFIGVDNCSDLLRQLDLGSCHYSKESPKGYIFINEEVHNIMSKKTRTN